MSQIDSQSYDFESIDQLGSYPSKFHRQQFQSPQRTEPLNNFSRTLDYLNYAHNLQIHRSSDNKFIDNRVPDLVLKKKYRQPYLESTPLKGYAEYLSASPRSYETSLPPAQQEAFIPPVYYDPLPPSQFFSQPREVVYHRAGDIAPIYQTSPAFVERQSPYQTYHNHPQYNGYPIISSNQYGVVLDNYSNLPRDACGLCPQQNYVDQRQNLGYIDWEADRRRINQMLTGREDAIIKNGREEDKLKVGELKGGREVGELRNGREVGELRNGRDVGELRNEREVSELKSEREENIRKGTQAYPDYENKKYVINKAKAENKNHSFSVIEEEEMIPKGGKQFGQKTEGMQTNEDLFYDSEENLSNLLEKRKNIAANLQGERVNWQEIFIKQQQNIENFDATAAAQQNQQNDYSEEKDKIYQLYQTMQDYNEQMKQDQKYTKLSELQQFVDSQMKSIQQEVFNYGFSSLENKVTSRR